MSKYVSSTPRSIEEQTATIARLTRERDEAVEARDGVCARPTAERERERDAARAQDDEIARSRAMVEEHAAAGDVSKAKWTPGPWRSGGTLVWALDETGTVNRFCAAVCGGYVLHSERTGGRIRTSAEELAANTRLIAAAPQLLEALEELYLRAHNFTSVNPSRDHRDLLEVAKEKARTAIVAAKGDGR